MIHELGAELAARIGEKGCPFGVVDGPEPTTQAGGWGRERIVIEHDTSGSASFGPARSQSINPKHRHVAVEGYKLTIYAKSAHPGATVFEHRRRATKVRNVVVAAMDYVAAVRKNRWLPTAGTFITPPDLVGAEKPGGAVYELKFTYESPIEERTFADATAEEFTVDATNLESTAEASLYRGEDDDSNPNNVPAAAETVATAI